MENMAQASEFARVLGRIQSLVSSNEKILVLIDGPAGAGKTTLASEIEKAFNSVNVVHMDDLYNGWEKPLTIELYKRIQDQIVNPHLKSDESTYSVFNWITNSFDSIETLEPKQMLVIEGVGSASKESRGSADLVIFIEVNPEVGIERVLNRDGKNITSQMLEWQSMEAKHFETDQTKRAADILVNGSF